jgi:peptide/nickel transport system permease protein
MLTTVTIDDLRRFGMPADARQSAHRRCRYRRLSFALIAIFGPWIVRMIRSSERVAALMPPSAHTLPADQPAATCSALSSRHGQICHRRLGGRISLPSVPSSAQSAAYRWLARSRRRPLRRRRDGLPLFVAMAMVAALGNRAENIIIATAIINRRSISLCAGG